MRYIRWLLLTGLFVSGLGFAQEPAPLPAAKVPLVTLAGTVFLDKNNNAKQDPAETGLKDVIVSDGLQAVRTDEQGQYRLANVDPAERRVVFAVIPSGYRPVDSFYHPIPAGPEPAPVAFALATDPASAAVDFSFIQITDLHVGTAASGRNLLDLLCQMQSFKPAFVVATGDMVNDGNRAAELDHYGAAARLSPIPVYGVPGNHDLGSSVAAKAHYAQIVGPERYAFDYGGRHFLILNCITDVKRQYQWIKAELDLQPPGKEILVFQHYPPDARLMEFLAAWNTRAVFSGHWHSSRVFMFGKILYVNTPPLRFGGIDLSPWGSRRISFHGGKMMLDDVFPEFGTREAWAASLSRPSPEAGVPLPAPQEDWPMQQHDPARSGITGDPVQPPLRLAWRRTVGGSILGSSPVVVRDTVYIGVADEENRGYAGVYALDAVTSAEKWRYASSSSVKNTVSFANGLVYGATVEGAVFALEAATGKCQWQYSLGSPLERWMYSSPLVAGQVVYAGCGPVFVALKALDGQLLWSANTQAADWISCRASPTLGDGLVFTGFNWSSIGLLALDAKTGEQRWNNKGNAFATHHAAPSFAGKMLYDASGDKLHALDAASGREQWTFPVAGWGLASPVVAGETVICASADGKIFGVDRVTGTQRWVYDKAGPAKFSFVPYAQEPAPLIGSPAVSGTTAYLGTSAGRFLALDTATGQERWSMDLGAPVTSAPALSGNAAYIATYDGTVYAFVSAK